jgi:hypothetical protein
MLISSGEASRILGAEGWSRPRWPALDHATLLQACPAGVLVVRLGRGHEPPPGATWSDLADAVRFQPYLGFPAWLQVQAQLATGGRLACVVTVCGHPVLLADLVSFESVAGERIELGLERPGDWSALLHERRLVIGPGRRWLLLGARPCLGRAPHVRQRGEPANAGRSSTWTRWA